MESPRARDSAFWARSSQFVSRLRQASPSADSVVITGPKRACWLSGNCLSRTVIESRPMRAHNRAVAYFPAKATESFLRAPKRRVRFWRAFPHCEAESRWAARAASSRIWASEARPALHVPQARAPTSAPMRRTTSGESFRKPLNQAAL